MDCSTPGFLVLHYLLEFAQTHVYWVDDAIQPSHPLYLISSISSCERSCWAAVAVCVCVCVCVRERDRETERQRERENQFIILSYSVCGTNTEISSFGVFKITFSFVLYSWVTVLILWSFQVDRKGTQPFVYTYPFSPKLPSHPGSCSGCFYIHLCYRENLTSRISCSESQLQQATYWQAEQREKNRELLCKAEKASLPRCSGLDASGLWGCQPASLGMLGRFREALVHGWASQPWDAAQT